MIHIQVIERERVGLKVLIRRAVASGKIRSFNLEQIRGGLKISHRKHPGRIMLRQSNGPLLATLACNNRAREWQLLETFIGRLIYHFRSDISSINIQPEFSEAAE